MVGEFLPEGLAAFVDLDLEAADELDYDEVGEDDDATQWLGDEDCMIQQECTSTGFIYEYTTPRNHSLSHFVFMFPLDC